MRAKPSPSTRLSARVDALVGDAGEHGLVAGCQVVQDVQPLILVLPQLVHQGRVLAEEVSGGRVEGVGVGQ